MRKGNILITALLLLYSSTAIAEEIIITPGMNPTSAYTTIESASAGDVVLLEPGTYHFRLYLSKDGVVVKGRDKNNPPVFDYHGRPCGQWPGSDQDSWNNYGIQIQASNVLIENLVITGAKNDGHASALYASPMGVAKEPADAGTIKNNIVLRNLKVYDNDEGISGLGDPLIVDGCEIYNNGSVGPIPRHNIYLQGGTAVIKNSKIHDSTATNIQVRTKLCRIEYCDIGAFGDSSHSILMITDKADAINGQAFEQRLILVGNRISGVRNHANGMAKLIALVNSNSYSGLSMFLEMYYNTFEGVPGNRGAVARLAYESSAVRSGVKMYNNILKNSINPVTVGGDSFTNPKYEIDIRYNVWGIGDFGAIASIMGVGNVQTSLYEQAATGSANPNIGLLPTHEPLGSERETVADMGAVQLGQGPETNPSPPKNLSVIKEK